MGFIKNKLMKKKISGEFAARLEQLKPDQTVRAVLLLSPGDAVRSFTARRQTRSQREEAVRAVRDKAGATLKDIDAILESIGGRRISTQADALGSILVETTPAGISALADAKQVKTILEDQDIVSAR